jgi:Arc/MetJ family transcription regulator
MRTNIDIDDDLMAAAMKRSGKTTKKAAVEEAMRYYVKSAKFKSFLKEIRGTGWNAEPEVQSVGLHEEPAGFKAKT